MAKATLSMHPCSTACTSCADPRWDADDLTTGKLRAMSLGTLKARISTLREKHDTVRGRSATVSSPLKGMVPIRKSHTWQGNCRPEVSWGMREARRGVRFNGVGWWYDTSVGSALCPANG
jgi:hypothetical protein